MDTALRLGGRHPLHPVHAALVLQPRPHALAGLGLPAGLHRDLDVLVAAQLGLGGVDDLGLPADALGVAQVHAQQVAGEQRRLVAARARLDLQDDVLVVTRVARHQQQAQFLGQLLALLLQLLDLGGEVGVVGGQLARGFDVVAGLLPGAVRGDDRGQLGVALVQLARVRLIGVDRRVGELLLQIGVLGDEFLDGSNILRLLYCGEGKGRATKNAGPGRTPRGRAAVDRRSGARYFLEPAALPKRASKRATRPPVSRIFCLPV